MAPSQGRSGVNQSYGISYGNQFPVGENAIGLIAGVNYSSGYSGYTNGYSGQYNLTGKVAEVDELTRVYDLNDSKGKFTSDWGGMLNLALSLSNNHKLSANFMLNH